MFFGFRSFSSSKCDALKRKRGKGFDAVASPPKVHEKMNKKRRHGFRQSLQKNLFAGHILQLVLLKKAKILNRYALVIAFSPSEKEKQECGSLGTPNSPSATLWDTA